MRVLQAIASCRASASCALAGRRGLRRTTCCPSPPASRSISQPHHIVAFAQARRCSCASAASAMLNRHRLGLPRPAVLAARWRGARGEAPPCFRRRCGRQCSPLGVDNVRCTPPTARWLAGGGLMTPSSSPRPAPEVPRRCWAARRRRPADARASVKWLPVGERRRGGTRNCRLAAQAGLAETKTSRGTDGRAWCRHRCLGLARLKRQVELLLPW